MWVSAQIILNVLFSLSVVLAVIAGLQAYVAVRHYPKIKALYKRWLNKRKARLLDVSWTIASSDGCLAYKLLLAALTEKQRRDLTHKGRFVVIGGYSGRHYHIFWGPMMNILAIHSGGRAIGICFYPTNVDEGGALVTPDCMLAQKIMLECNEHAALRIAHRFGA